jgi:hypothetical protein
MDKKITMLDVRRIANEALQEAQDGLTEEGLRKEMLRIVDKGKEKLVRSALGMTDDWHGGLEISCNGAFSRTLTTLSRENLERISNTILSAIFTPETVTLTDKEIVTLRKQYRKVYMYALKDHLEDFARREAEPAAQRLWEEYITSEDKPISPTEV